MVLNTIDYSNKKINNVKKVFKIVIGTIIITIVLFASMFFIDVSRMKSFIVNYAGIFEFMNAKKFYPFEYIDISQWDVSNVENMHYMFNSSKFNGDLSNWNISSVVTIAGMFKNCEFNNDSICKWNVSNIMNMAELFAYNKHFDQDISKWKVNKSCNLTGIYKDAAIHGTNRYYRHK